MKTFFSVIVFSTYFLGSNLCAQAVEGYEKRSKWEKIVIDSLISLELPKPIFENNISNPVIDQWEEISYRALGEFCNVTLIKKRKLGLNYHGSLDDSLYHKLLDQEYDFYVQATEKALGSETIENLRADVDGFEGRFFKIKGNNGNIQECILLNVRGKFFQLTISYQTRFASEVEIEKGYIFNSLNILK